jgi:hypothetical protein
LIDDDNAAPDAHKSAPLLDSPASERALALPRTFFVLFFRLFSDGAFEL